MPCSSPIREAIRSRRRWWWRNSSKSNMIIPNGEDLIGTRIHHPRDGAGAVGMLGERHAGPALQIIATDGGAYQIDSCVIYACTANNSKGKRTAN